MKRDRLKRLTPFAASLLTVSGLSATASAYAGRPKTVVAVYTQADSGFSETVTLYADGKYQQEEKEKDARPARGPSLHDLLFPAPVIPVSLREPKRVGAWRVLDRPGGALLPLNLPLKAGAGLPAGAVVELKGAMPFGLTWDNRLPYALSGDRTVPAASFRATPPAALGARREGHGP